MRVDEPATVVAPAGIDRWMFAVSALYTTAIGLAVIGAPDWVASSFYRHAMKEEADAVRFVVGDFGGTLVLWGIAYAAVALDPSKNRAIVWIGAFGKVFIFLSMTQRFLSGGATAVAFGVGVGDLVFAVLYGLFLWRTRVRAPSPAPAAAT